MPEHPRPANGPFPQLSRGAARARRTRRVRWFLWRARVLILALAIGLAVSATLSALRPSPPPMAGVLTVNSDIAAGAVLSTGEVTETDIPVDLVPNGVLSSPEEVAGRTAAVGLPRGGVLTRHALVSIDAHGSAPAGTVMVPVRLSDPEILRFLSPGSHIDLLLVPTSGVAPEGAELAPTLVLARRALVLPMPAPATPPPAAGLLGGAPDEETSAVLLVAVSPTEAQDVTASARSGYIGAVIVE